MSGNRTLLDKWRLVRAAARDNKRLSTGDVAVLLALCDRCGSKHNPDAPPMAGHALLGKMSGLSRRATIDSTRRLIDAGYISILELGSGTRGTTYTLNFSRGEAGCTTRSASTSGEPDFTTEVNHTSPLGTVRGEADFTESPLTEAPLEGRLRKEIIDCAAPTAPPVPGAVAPAQSVTAQDGFENLWRAYGYRRAKAEARRVFEKFALRGEALDQAIRKAAAWREAWEKQGKADAPRFTLAKWLQREEFECDPPTGYQPKQPKSAATAMYLAPAMVGKINPFSAFGTFTAEFIDAGVKQAPDGSGLLRLELSWSGHEADSWHEFPAETPDGEAMLDRIKSVLGLRDIDDVEDLLFRPFLCTISEDLTIAYAPAPANDNEDRQVRNVCEGNFGAVMQQRYASLTNHDDLQFQCPMDTQGGFPDHSNRRHGASGP